MNKNFIIIIIVIALVSAVIGAVIFSLCQTLILPDIGDTVSDTGEDGAVHNFVYVGATTKLYVSDNSSESIGVFLDIFDDIHSNEDLADLIDNSGFPYELEYQAVTVATPARYMIRTDSGSTYWIEP